MSSVWDEIEQKLIAKYSLPHNRVDPGRGDLKGLTPQQAAKKVMAEIRSGVSALTPEDYAGPKLFLRVAGPRNRVYSGEWWFDGSLLDDVEGAFSRIYFTAADKKRAIRDILREVLAISREWNEITEVWALELPAGQVLRGYWGPGTPQQLFANVPLSAKGNRMLVGKARQIYFVTKNPLWVQQYRDLSY